MSELARLYAQAGDHQRASRLVDDALNLASQVNEYFLLPVIQLHAWEIYSAQDDHTMQKMAEQLLSDAIGSAQSMQAAGFLEMIMNKTSSKMQEGLTPLSRKLPSTQSE
jgi:hypothetical protein